MPALSRSQVLPSRLAAEPALLRSQVLPSRSAPEPAVGVAGNAVAVGSGAPPVAVGPGVVVVGSSDGRTPLMHRRDDSQVSSITFRATISGSVAVKSQSTLMVIQWIAYSHQ